MAAAAERDAGDGRLGGFGGRVGGVKTRAEDEAGGEGVDTHALRSEFAGEGAREGEHGALGGGVGEGTAVAALAAGERGEVHDAGAAASLRGGDEMRGGGASDAAHAADVEGDHVGPEFVVGLEEGAAADEGAGIVDENVEAAEEGDGLGDEGVALLGGGEIGAGTGAAPAELRGLRGEFARAVGAAAVVDKHVAPRAEQVRADGATDALGAGGDEGAFAEEFAHGEAHD